MTLFRRFSPVFCKPVPDCSNLICAAAISLIPVPQIEGRGNGIKTNVVNNVEVAKALERPADCAPPWHSAPARCLMMAASCVVHLLLRCPSPPCVLPADIVKWYGCELGAQTKFDKKTGTSIVNGAHDTGKLVELLEVGFFVIFL